MARDDRGQTLLHYVLAVVAATIVTVVVCTILAERIYVRFQGIFGP